MPHLHDVGEAALDRQVQRSLAVKVAEVDRSLGEVDEHLDGLEEAARGRVVQRRVAVPVADRERTYPGGEHQTEHVELILKLKEMSAVCWTQQFPRPLMRSNLSPQILLESPITGGPGFNPVMG